MGVQDGVPGSASARGGSCTRPGPPELGPATSTRRPFRRWQRVPAGAGSTDTPRERRSPGAHQDSPRLIPKARGRRQRSQPKGRAPSQSLPVPTGPPSLSPPAAGVRSSSRAVASSRRAPIPPGGPGQGPAGWGYRAGVSDCGASAFLPPRLAPPLLRFPPLLWLWPHWGTVPHSRPLFLHRAVGLLLKGQTSCPQASPAPALVAPPLPGPAPVTRGGCRSTHRPRADAGCQGRPGGCGRWQHPNTGWWRRNPRGPCGLPPRLGEDPPPGRAATAGRGSSQPRAPRGRGRKSGVSPDLGWRRRAEVGTEARQDPVQSLFDPDEEGGVEGAGGTPPARSSHTPGDRHSGAGQVAASPIHFPEDDVLRAWGGREG